MFALVSLPMGDEPSLLIFTQSFILWGKKSPGSEITCNIGAKVENALFDTRKRKE